MPGSREPERRGFAAAAAREPFGPASGVSVFLTVEAAAPVETAVAARRRPRHAPCQ
jgi:hypothetical protein